MVSCSRQVFLNEAWAHVHVELYQRAIADVLEAVDLARLDDEDVARARLELVAVHDPASAPFLNELDLVIGMTMRTWAAPRSAIEQEYRNAHVSTLGADELV